MFLNVDSLIELLRDGKWHSIKELSRRSKIHEFKIVILTDFLAEYSFLELNKKAKKARFTEIFADFAKKTAHKKTKRT